MNRPEIGGGGVTPNAVSELDGTSGLAGYGPPYNHASSGQRIAFIHLQKWFGVNIAINTEQDLVLAPLRSIYGQPALRSAIGQYQGASAKQQAAWTTATLAAAANATIETTRGIGETKR